MADEKASEGERAAAQETGGALRATVGLYLSAPLRRALELVVGELADLHLEEGVRALECGLPIAEVGAVVQDLRAARRQLAVVAEYASKASLDVDEVQAVAAAGRALTGLDGVIEELERVGR